jgi:hypothetical protein
VVFHFEQAPLMEARGAGEEHGTSMIGNSVRDTEGLGSVAHRQREFGAPPPGLGSFRSKSAAYDPILEKNCSCFFLARETPASGRLAVFVHHAERMRTMIRPEVIRTLGRSWRL